MTERAASARGPHAFTLLSGLPDSHGVVTQSEIRLRNQASKAPEINELGC